MTNTTFPDLDRLPAIYEDEGLEMGESLPHYSTGGILFYCLQAHCRRLVSPFTVLPDMNLHYHGESPGAYVSPDIMIVPVGDLPKSLTSYELGETGPVPVLVIEVLSPRTAQQGDLTFKPGIYAELGVSEYILIDATKRYLPCGLLIKKRGSDGTWLDEEDSGLGIESALGFRIVFDVDGEVRIINTMNNRRYPRPDEADAQFDEIERLKARIAKLESKNTSTNGH